MKGGMTPRSVSTSRDAGFGACSPVAATHDGARNGVIKIAFAAGFDDHHLHPDDAGRRQSLRGRRFRERMTAGRHLVEDDANREEVRPKIEQSATCLLGRHVGAGSHHYAWFGDRR